ncbi:hypothetical protein QQG74_09310 [Micromonospora sp. FIMYZ51]|uniref:hypothetical protein n=1 Tax=Micromonospora sp. FIMYZ51 TaxID=3051832 RepID=UPI00311DB172
MSLRDLDRAGKVAATLAAGASGKRVTYSPDTGWTTRHGRAGADSGTTDASKTNGSR